MRPSGRILIVDDDERFLDSYRTILGDAGYMVETATTREQALARLDEKDWDVVLLDQKLQGASGPDIGIEMINEVHARALGARPIIVTAFATDDSIRRAFDAGTYDFLEKKGPFKALLLAKLRNAIDLVYERKMATLGKAEAEAEIRELWQKLPEEHDKSRKGLLLEELVDRVFRSVEGFHVTDRRRKSEDEEIDLVVRNESRDPLWARESPCFLVECKNWSRPVPRSELDVFIAKLRRRFGRARLGFFIAPGGVEAGFKSALTTKREGETLVVFVDHADLETLVMAPDRNQALKALHDRALVEIADST